MSSKYTITVSAECWVWLQVNLSVPDISVPLRQVGELSWNMEGSHF